MPSVAHRAMQARVAGRGVAEEVSRIKAASEGETVVLSVLSLFVRFRQARATGTGCRTRGRRQPSDVEERGPDEEFDHVVGR